ncbi:armadillo repeat-containing protein 12-like isoform X1 [Pseudonaja textilis]|uniref:Armadillo repeat-containing protein 12-like n=1 Tax=Pseudonaja textilis TaxID=8673 RepID=A0A670ZYS2_PSETE|nr:armadillo repeat-containing protein 12-like isoform X1 [Pseudonaja textilis]XP_026572647.1 armadillo repeat-containing protein 12-like isoform X1 [Pseudonaja textilis]XP_026572648.1 armadillo repeat-containing protein 12-like isoform X1 [Pseudonaja textilis]XP_026573914.1 armadillo repeat-containing protein 12-like isoform X1 [Pseudonaja textilis]XP_026573916.1 armadillo repeat-containing protein 12-like isoform X1 [Pseudonaja textilis]XP_026573917.1 armadillo repeat-containing protein 12-l
MSLSPNLDDDTKRMTLRNIAQIIYLTESEASGCTNDDIKLVASFLDDRDKETKTEALNALKAFTAIWKFKIKIQEYVPQIIEIVTSNWDNDLQLAGLKLLNTLHIPDHTHASLRTQLTNFMDILLTANTSTKVQVLKFLHTLIEKEDLLYDIMNCQVPADFLNLFQTSHPGNLLCKMLAFVERLSEGRQSPQYQSMQWDYNKNSLHEIIFGDNSRLSERLLALIVHPEEDVQTQACKLILSLKINKEESRIFSGHTLGSELSGYPLESTRQSQIANASLISQPLIPTTESSSDAPHRNSGGSFHPLPSTNEISGGSVHPLPSTNEISGGSFHPLPSTNEISGGSFHPLPGTNEVSGGSFHPLLGTNETSDSSVHPLLGTNETSDGSFHPLPGTNETGHSFYPLERADHSFQPLPYISMVGSERVLEEPMDSFHTPPVARSDENDNST